MVLTKNEEQSSRIPAATERNTIDIGETKLSVSN